MKQSEIQEVINTNPTAVFSLNQRYTCHYIITGFVKETHWNNRGSKPMTYALAQQIIFDADTQTIMTCKLVENIALRSVAGVFSNSVDSYKAHKIDMAQRSANARIVKEQNENAMNDIKPELDRLLKALNIENKERNYSTATTFKIEVDVKSAIALLALLNTFVPEPVNN